MLKDKFVKEKGALTALDANPCKMCMPMGVVNAAYGIAGNMTILHGSQGCSTYIRRHMATHYNEPIDIASSSLTEEGTVYGGESNLKKGIDNLIKLYNPRLVTVATTCLAETIGEDVPRILESWKEEHPHSEVAFIPVPAPGYGGTQFEGYFRFLRALIESLPLDATPNNTLNVVCGPMSPADMRYLKELVASFGISATFLPDISDNLDGVRRENYERLPSEGTLVEDISHMAGARLTLELSTFVQEDYSVASYLEDSYGIPYKRLHLPVGLRDTDAFVDELVAFAQACLLEPQASSPSVAASQENSAGQAEKREACAQQTVAQTEKIAVSREYLIKERGRYIDAMIDSHKYNAEGRAVVFGEPDFIASVVRMCCEEGIMPVVVAVGTKCSTLDAVLRPEIERLADRLLIDSFEIVDGVDFATIERLAVEQNANVLIGSSDGRRIEEALGIPLIRCAFPIHDHIGGQRVRMLGYQGSLVFIDRITNALLQKKQTTFRTSIKDTYLVKDQISKTSVAPSKPRIDTDTHPCFSEKCSTTNARIHLPVAPKCNISCNYCVRKFDCVNESRPGVTSRVLTPAQALARYLEAKEKIDHLSVVGIAGPGDALADFENTKETLELIRAQDPEVTFCLSTNGLMLPRYAAEIAALGVTHVTVTMNTIDVKTGSKIYRYAKCDGITYVGEAAAAVLLANQIAGIEALVALGIIVKINTVYIPGINEQGIVDVATKARELGAFIGNVMQFIPVKGSVFEYIPQVDMHALLDMRTKCSPHIKQMTNCQQCRADAAGKIHEDLSHLFADAEQPIKGEGGKGAPRLVETTKPQFGAEENKEQGSPVKIAVASRGGMVVDQHFGHASAFHIYSYDGTSVRYIERRDVEKYCSGIEECESDDKTNRLDASMRTIADCTVVLALRIGHAPEQALYKRGITPIITCDRIEDAVVEAVANSTQQAKGQTRDKAV